MNIKINWEGIKAEIKNSTKKEEEFLTLIQESKDYPEAIRALSKKSSFREKNVNEVSTKIPSNKHSSIAAHELPPIIEECNSPSVKDFFTANRKITSVFDHKWQSTHFFKALDAWFSFDKLKKDLNKTKNTNPNKEKQINKAIKLLKNYDNLINFFKDGENQQYQEIAHKILDKCIQGGLGKSPIELKSNEHYIDAAMELNALYKLHTIDIPDDEIQAVYSMLISKTSNEEKEKLRKIALDIYAGDLQTKYKSQFLIEAAYIIKSKPELIEEQYKVLERKIQSSPKAKSAQLLPEEFLKEKAIYSRIDALLGTSENTLSDAKEFALNTSSRLPEAYENEIIVGKSPVSNFFNPYPESSDYKSRECLQTTQFLKLYDTEEDYIKKECDVTGGAHHFNYKEKAKCLFINSGNHSSRRHLTFKIDKNKDIWLRRCSENYQVGVFRLIDSKLVNVPTFDNERLKLEVGDIFYVGNIEFELINHGELMVRNIKEQYTKNNYHDAIKQKLNPEELYTESAPAYKIKANNEGTFDKEEEFATTTLLEDFADNYKAILASIAKIAIDENIWDIAATLKDTLSKDRLNERGSNRGKVRRR